MFTLKISAPVSLALHSFVLALVLLSAVPAASESRLLKGQTIYVPAYSQIYHGDRQQSFQLAVTLSVRNTDLEHAITVVSVDYFDSDGKLLKRYLENEMKLSGMASAEFIVKESDRTGGLGANFVVVWKSQEKVSEPIAETVMIGTMSQQGISFTSRGRAIKEE
jgi:hypothetical protein